jgi:hypothetical protein
MPAACTHHPRELCSTPALALAILIFLGSGCEQVKKTEPSQPSREPAPAKTTLPPQRESSAHPIGASEIEDLRKHGLRDPIAQIVEDLRSHPEVIPHPGELGGNMGFYDPDGIHVLSARWVYARFDDGHITGDGVFEFTVQPDGSLAWKVVSSRLDWPQ